MANTVKPARLTPRVATLVTLEQTFVVRKFRKPTRKRFSICTWRARNIRAKRTALRAQLTDFRAIASVFIERPARSFDTTENGTKSMRRSIAAKPSTEFTIRISKEIHG